MNFGSMILQMARAVPDAPAVRCDDAALSYREMSTRALALAGAMRARGLVPGDRVLIQMHNRLEIPELMLATWAAGLVVVPVNAKLHQNEVAHILTNSAARQVFVSDGVNRVDTTVETIETGTAAYQALLSHAPLPQIAETDAADLAWLFYTSGTTGRPKGAMLSNRNLLAMANAYYADIDQLDPEDTMLVAAPASHGAGLYMLAALLKGAQVLISTGFDVAEVETALRQYRRLSLFAVPTILNRLVAAWETREVPLQNLRCIVYGGAPMYVADLERAIDLFGPKLFQLFAQGETPMTASGLPKRLHRRDHTESARLLGSCGYPRTGSELSIRDPETGATLPAGEAGEICVQGETVMLGYWNNPEATAKALRDGWLWTGDLGYCDADGLLHVVDRSKDMIISGGTNIYPREVEEALLTHPAVAEAAVIGVPDADWGESVAAYVVVGGASVSEQELDAHVCDQIARFKRPKHYRFVAELPKSDYAKILKSELRAWYAEGLKQS
ncbi:MAG: AMP-binding protein [Proteobacteria bacterium]|nr:AMP-binding protein [Pseudomonadota bacterium]